NEAQDAPVVQVLDRAVPPMYKSGPKIRLNMALAGAVSLFLGSFLAFFLSYLDRQRALVRESRP
ncbi:MAG: GumC family protein, partial [Opitutaceae bacterium]